MELLLKTLERFETLEEGILFEQVGRDTEHGPRKPDSCHNRESDADVANTYHPRVKHARAVFTGLGVGREVSTNTFPCYKKRCLIMRPDTDGACTW